jgi:phage terminase large subunit-like protein
MQKQSGTDVVDVITFAEASWGLNVELLPVQKFVLTAYYGMPLDDEYKNIPVYNDVRSKLMYTFTQAEFMHFLIEEGRCNQTTYTPGKAFRELVLCAGRRGTKSTLAAVVSNYEVYRLVRMGDPQKYYGFPPGQEICVTCVATSDAQAGVLFGMIRDRSLVCDYIKDRIVHSTQSYFNIQTDTDVELYGKRKKSSIWVFCGGCSSVGLRGHNNIVVIMDEEAFFLDNEGRFSGDEVYRALTPSIATFVPKAKQNIMGLEQTGDGKILNLSSPYGKYGIFWDNFNRTFQDQDSSLMFKMYTAMLNPTVDAAFLRTEKRRNPVTFVCEYGAEFSDRVTAWMDNTEKFTACVNTNVTTNQRTGKVGVEYFMGIDPGFVNDGTGIAIVYYEDGVIKLAWADVYYSGVSDVWDYQTGIYRNCMEFAGYEMIPVTELVKKVGDLCKQFPVKSGWFDQHQGYSMVDLLHRAGMSQFRTENVSAGLNTQISQLVKQLFMDGMVQLFDHPVLVPELLGLQQEKKGMNMVVKSSPKPGAHDDISSAYLRAVWECYNSSMKTSKAVSIAFGGGLTYGRNAGTVNPVAAMRQRVFAHGIPPRMANSQAAKIYARRALYGR